MVNLAASVWAERTARTCDPPRSRPLRQPRRGSVT